MFHLYSLQVRVVIQKPVDVKLPTGIAKLFDEDQGKETCTVHGEFGPYHRIFKVYARTKNEADVKVEDRARAWLDKMDARFIYWYFFNDGITYLGEIEDGPVTSVRE